MKVGLLTALLLSAALAGCTAGTANPHLLAPKLVIHPQEDGNVTLYVHSAFGERVYDELSLAVENVTVATRADAFSLETSVASPGFFVEVAAVRDDEWYHLRARIDVDVEEPRIRVVALDEKGMWQEPQTFALPYERIIERVVA